MNIISGYQIQSNISNSCSSVVYKAIQINNQQPVILKLLPRDYPGADELMRYRREYEMIRRFDADEIIKAYRLENHQQTLLLVLEDFGGESLKPSINQHPLTLPQFFKIALQIAKGLSEIHAKNIIHKDINPSNIVFNQKTEVVKIIDFNIATQLTEEKVAFENCDSLKGTLAYISPEQTGRINHPLDYRSDFYSLGITFYELLTGQLPFLSTDILELVHAHLAKQPPHPSHINANIPPIVSDLVIKLMAKNPEDRYQSSSGLIHDLKYCQQLLNSNTAENSTLLQLSEQDICNHFLIPETLYGRNSEIPQLLAVFQQIINQDDVEWADLNLTDHIFDEDQLISILKSSHNLQTILSVDLIKGILCYLFENYSAALQNFNLAQQYQHSMAGLLASTQYPFYQSLTMIALYPTVDHDQKKQFLKLIEKNHHQIAEWAKNAPNNFQHYAHIIAAETHRILGQKLAAIEQYDLGILSAQQIGYLQDEALANELAAKFYLGWGKAKIARVYLSDAYCTYQSCGATAKARQLAAKYSDLLTQNHSSFDPESISQMHSSTTSTSQPKQVLDIESLITASQALSHEIVLKNLLKNLIQIILENTAAQSGFLILETDGELLIEAAAGIDQEVQVLQSMPLEYRDKNGEMPLLSSAIINYVYRTQNSIVLPNAAGEGDFIQERYIQTYQVKSVICAPLLNQGKLSGIVYLENNLVTAAFTTERLEILQLLSRQAAIAIDHARLYSSLEKQVIERTEELSHSQAKFFGIVNIAEDAIISIDEYQTIQLFNQGAEKIFGYRADEILGQSLEILLPPSARQRHRQEINNFGQDSTIARRMAQRPPIDIFGQRKNGETFPAEASISKLKLRDGWLYTVMLKDVTQRKQAEEQLRQSEANLSAAQRVAHVGSWDFNILTQEMSWSEELYRIFGLEPNQNPPSYHELILMIHPDDRVSWEQQKQQSLIKKRAYTDEFRLIRPNGEIRYIESRGEVVLNELGEVIRLFGVSLDITEHKQIEIALQEREKQYRDLVQTANCIILRWDVQGNIIFLNQYGSEFFCWPEMEIIGKSVMETIVPSWDSSGQDLQNLMQKICQQPDAFVINENENIRQNGERVWINWANKPIFNNAGELIEILSIGIDITARKHSEEALAQKNIDLEAAKKAAEKANQVKSQFLANMSHELRTPLNIILGFAQVMQRTLKYDPEQFQQESREQLQIIHNSGNHLLSLINDVLDMSKIEAGKVVFSPHPFDLYDLLRSLEAMFQSLTEEEGLKLEFQLAEEIPQWIETDEAKLRQILINLLSNAIKFTQTGGIILRVWGKETIYFEVEDTGCGITQQQLQKLFDAFYQVEHYRSIQQGTGLGLTITQRYIKMFGGEIQVQSTLGKGSLFQFYIPVTLVEPLNPPETQFPLSIVHLAPNQPSYRILVVEDFWESRLLLVKLLKSVGFEAVREAENGKEAVDIFEGWQPHLIWMDMRMPVMDGYEATQRIRNHLKGQAPAIIALTASALEQEKQIILSSGCDDFVHKPFQQQVIFEKLHQHLGVEYIYDDPSVTDRPQTYNSVPPLTAEQLSQVPREWLVQLHQAASLADAEWVCQLIEELPADDGDIIQALEDWVKSFRYDLIEELAQSSIGFHQ